jgi:hypothetical protein
LIGWKKVEGIIMANMLAKIGGWAFIVGVVIALVAGFIPDQYQGVMTAILVVVGLIVGFLNVTERETTPFLMAAVAIMIALYTAGSGIERDAAALGDIGRYLLSVMNSVNVFVFPATIVVALKAIYALARDA